MEFSRTGLVTCVLAMAVVCTTTLGQERNDGPTRVVRIGVVGASNNQTFEKLVAVLNRKGFPSKHVRYSDYEAMVAALEKGEVDIAWNSPLAHARFHVRNQCESQALAMRDTDVGLRVTLIVTPGSGINSLEDVSGKRVIVGRRKHHEGLLSAFFLRQGTVDSDKVKLVQLEETDAAGKRTDTPEHILQALGTHGDAAVVPLRSWEHAVEWRKQHPGVKQVWTSPEFNHCVFTAAPSFDAKLGRQFTELMTNLDPQDPLVAAFNRAERTRQWLPGDSKGFESLVEALQELEKP